MFPEMCRKDKEVKDALGVLAQADWCVVAFNSPLGYPYPVAVNHVVIRGKIYFHCAQKGFKLDCLNYDPRVCVQAVTRATVVPDDCTADYLSAVSFGRARLVLEPEIKRGILIKLMQRFSPNHPETESCTNRGVDTTAIVEISLEHISAKENKAL